MHILMVPSWYRTKESPNRGVFFREQAVALSKRGHKVDLLFWYFDADSKSFFEVVESDGVTEYFIHLTKSRFRINHAKLVHLVLKFARTIYRDRTPDIIHVQSYSAVRVIQYYHWLSGIPYVVTEHSSDFKLGLLGKKNIERAQKFYNRASAVFAVSNGLKETLQPIVKRKVKVIPNLVNDIFFQPDFLSKSETSFHFVSVTSLDQKKGTDILIRSFYKAFKDNPNVNLKIAGKGPDKEILEQLVFDLGLSERVMFLGDISRFDCVSLLQQSHVFVLPSRVETFGVVFVEAMAMGLPIIMAKTDAFQSLVTEDTGLAVEVGSVEDLASKLKLIESKFEEYDSKIIREFCKERFSESVVADLIVSNYRDILESTDY